MGWSSVIGFRESVEAALIVSIVLAYLRRHRMSGDARLVRWSTALAVATSLLLGAAIVAVGSTYDGWKSDVFEGFVTLAVVIGLTWMTFVVRREGTIASESGSRVDDTLTAWGLGKSGAPAIAALAFVGVLREGVATALFLIAAATPAEGEAIAAAAKLIGAGFGLAAAIGTGVALYLVGVRMYPRTFRRVIGGVLIVITAGLAANFLHEFQEAGWIPILDAHAFDVSSSLSDEQGVGAILRGLLGYHADATWLEVAGWSAFLVVVGGAYLGSLVLRSNVPTESDTSRVVSDSEIR
jgi:high-affinity iron transporter